MHAKDWALHAVLQERQQWVIPVYQRTYAWETSPEKQLPKLWDDLREQALYVLEGGKPKPHFVGAIIYSEPKEQPFGTVNKRFLVDGQQRITTFSLALCALRENARDQGLGRIVATIGEYLFNARSPSMAEPEREQFKLWSSSFDRPLYTTIALKTSDEVRASFNSYFYKNGTLIPGGAPKVLAAYWYLQIQIKSFITERAAEGIDAETVLTALLAGFLNGFQIVVVQLGQDDDAQSIFSSLNGNAEPLTSFDLIRNDIFHRARKAFEDDDALYEQEWKELETGFWKQEVKQGRLKRPRTDHLIAHTLVAETAQDIQIGQVANEYRKFAEARAFPSVADEVRSLMKYGRAYHEMEMPSKGSSFARLLSFLKIWDTAALHPVVLWTEVHDLSQTRKDSVFSLLESYLVRRDICGLGNKNYNKIAAGALREMHSASDPVVALFEYIVGLPGEASRFPNDLEVLGAILRQPVYRQMGSQKLRYVLRQIETELRNRFDEDVTIATDNLTVEHIMPASWAEHWPLPSGQTVSYEDPLLISLFDESVPEETRKQMEIRENLKDTLGNLTMVTSSLNPSLSNGPWTEKRGLIAQSLLALNREVAKQEVWGESSIKDRGKTLASILNSIWPYPKAIFDSIVREMI